MPHTPSLSLHNAASYLSSGASPAKVSTTTKLELYGLFKYLTVSPTPQGSRPSIFDMTGRAKWDAWSSASKTYEDRGSDAEKRYLDIARELGWAEGAASQQDKSDEHKQPGSSEDIWDSDDSNSRSGGGGGGMGNSVSSMAPPPAEPGDSNTLHGLAIGGDAGKLSEFMKTHPEVDINELDEFNYTALHLACDRGSLAVATVLLKHGADPNIKDPDDFTAAELANVAGHDHIAALFSS
ncbi:hypothetical protein BV22DRAFT_1192780, partial [Leucogyrophana mollusca]